MNTIAGRVVLKESGVGIPDLLVVLSSGAQQIDRGAPVTAFRVSVLTNAEGAFAVTYDDADLGRGDSKARLSLQIQVLAPDEPGIRPEAQVLYSAPAPRESAGRVEQYIVRIATAQLEKAAIAVPSGIADDPEPATNVVSRLDAIATRQNHIVDGSVAAAKKLVDAHRTRVAGFHTTFRPKLVKSVSKLSKSPLHPERIVGAQDSVRQKMSDAAKASITTTINSDNPKQRAPARGFISLTEDEITALGADGEVAAAAVAQIAAANGQTTRPTDLRALDRLPLCRPRTPHVDCARALFGLPPIPGPDGTDDTDDTEGTEGTEDTEIESRDLARFLGRLIEPLSAPEEKLVTGRMPVATRDSVQRSVKAFSFDPSPADVPSFHDFNSLQIAFDYVWQEAIDQGVLDLAENAYDTIVELGGTPEHRDHSALHPVGSLVAEGKVVIRANAPPTVVITDTKRKRPPAGTVLPAPNLPQSQRWNGETCGANVRDHRTPNRNPTKIEDPVERLPALLEALQKKLVENYSFTVYGANAQERSINFGILNTFRQKWTPLAYQAGPLVRSIPMAPKQTQKLVITRKTTKKRTTKELENNLRVLKDETSSTNRAEQEIVKKATTSTSLTFSGEVKGDFAIGSGTATTTFKRDAAKSSDDIKKAFREAVFKAAQEFKQEKTTEINTEETSEYESIETTEISNPNDEIAVTYLFYELQRRYRVHERLYRVQPVVLVAQEFPRPEDIDAAWLVQHDWILRRAILDDSFLPILETIAATAGDEIAIDEMRVNVEQQRCIVGELRRELSIATKQAGEQRAVMDRAVYEKSGASTGGLIVGALFGPLVGAAAEKVGDWAFGDSAEDNANNRQALQERASEAADHARDVLFRLEREVTALNALTETFTKALREHNNHLTEIARLQVHVKDNIMHYMQAVWRHEPPDQRYFRLHETPVPDLQPKVQSYRVTFDEALPMSAAPHTALARFGGRNAKLFPVEAVTKLEPAFDYKPLSQVADLDRLLGFKGNYAIFPLLESNVLTDFMMDPYVDRATGQLIDPSDPLNWSIDEFSEYVCCLAKELTVDELELLRPELNAIHQKILSNPLRDDDVLVVPTNSLFIEALPATHTLLERFKLDHRMIDVKKAQAEARQKELDNVRMAARILAGDRGDPHVDKKIVIEGGGNFVVPTDP